jgi:hypothetical protein
MHRVWVARDHRRRAADHDRRTADDGPRNDVRDAAHRPGHPQLLPSRACSRGPHDRADVWRVENLHHVAFSCRGSSKRLCVQPTTSKASTPSILVLRFEHGGRLGAGRRRARSDRRDGRQRCQTGAEPARAGRESSDLRGVRRADPRSAAPSIAGRPEVRRVPIRGRPARHAPEPLQPPRQQRQPVEVALAPSMTRVPGPLDAGPSRGDASAGAELVGGSRLALTGAPSSSRRANHRPRQGASGGSCPRRSPSRARSSRNTRRWAPAPCASSSRSSRALQA